MIPGISWPYMALAVALWTVLTFGGGWYMGETHVIKTEARAVAALPAKAAKDQAAVDLRDRKVADQDTAQRQQKNDAGDVKYKLIYRDRAKLVPGKCPPVPASAMKLLNDPDLAGELTP